LIALAALAAPLAAAGAPPAGKAGGPGTSAFLPASLRAAAQANPDEALAVIVQGTDGKDSDGVAADVAAETAQDGGKAKGLKRRFASISGVAAELTGKQVLKLAARKGIFAITEDSGMRLAGYSNDQDWPSVSGVTKFWSPQTSKLPYPTIAIVDSGIDASRPDFGGRVIQQVTMTSLTPNSPGDGRGHGTFVASIAAGQADGHTGAVPRAKLVSLDVMDDSGMALTSDVIAACDWIVKNKDTYGIRVANFSLHSSQPSSFRYDPLDKAVEKLWFSGVVVVAAAGNYAVNGQESRVAYAPANDPFVLTVGATDINGTGVIVDDFNAPWSAYGYTYDGFAKPEISAPGRYLIGAVPQGSTMALERPDRIVAPGYMRMSGTSFAAPIVSGAAAGLLALNPGWTPDQVKGALMVSANPVEGGAPLSYGIGQVSVLNAMKVTKPPNPNLALDRFLVVDFPCGGSIPAFDSVSWSAAAEESASWDAASWNDASWDAASWDAASWNAASSSDASWDALAQADSIWVN